MFGSKLSMSIHNVLLPSRFIHMYTKYSKTHTHIQTLTRKQHEIGKWLQEMHKLLETQMNRIQSIDLNQIAKRPVDSSLSIKKSQKDFMKS